MEEVVDKIITDRKILTKVSRETTQVEVDRMRLPSRLFLANKSAWTKGVGLAAIQIGEPFRFAYYIHQNRAQYLLNPKILQTWGEIILKEGCLSIPNKWFQVKRAVSIEYETHGKKKKATGFLAQLIQHEIDHMDGILVSERSEK